MRVKHLGFSLGWMAAGALSIGASAAQAVTVGVVLPQGQLTATPEAAEPVRQILISQLQGQSVTAVPLVASSGAPVDAEARTKHCDYVLYTRLEKKQSGGSMFSKLGGLSRLAPMAASALPLGALGGRGGGSLVGAAMQQAASSAMQPSAQQMMSPEQQMATQTAGSALASFKQGDGVTLDYRLMPVGSMNVLKSDSLSNKASGDGQDIIGPLLTQTASAVSAAAQGTAAPGSAEPQAPTAQNEPAKERGSFLGGVFGHRNNAAAAHPGATANLDCSQITAMSNTPGNMPVSFADCQKFQAAQQTYTQSAAAGTRPGDEEMTCQQITAELRQQQYATPDKQKVAATQRTLTQVQADLKKDQVIAAKMSAEDTATMAAASATDTATELATGGLVRGRAMEAAQKTVDARDNAIKEQLRKEQLPTQQKLIGQTGDLTTDFAGQLQSNPRLARLMQLADSKHCKGGGG